MVCVRMGCGVCKDVTRGVGCVSECNERVGVCVSTA